MPIESLQKAFKILTDPTRMRILFLLEREELAVQELVSILETAQSTVSRHLGILRDAGLLHDRREGTSHYYRFTTPSADEWSQTWRLAHQALVDDPAVLRDLASLDLVLRQREVRSRTWFDEVGPEWDGIRRVFNDDVHRARAMSRLITPRLRVADIGTGTGILARELATAGLEVVAIDRSQRMLAAAQRGLTDLPQGSIEFRLGEASHLPVGDGELDAAMAHMVLHYLASPGDAVQEMARIVRPGGKLVIVDFVHHEHEWLKRELGAVWQGFDLLAVRRWFSEAGLEGVELQIEEQAGAKGADLPQIFIASARRPTQGS